MLVSQQPGKALLHYSHTFHHADIINLNAQGQSIDENAKRSVGSRSALHPTKQHGSEYNTLMTCGTRYHLCPGQMEQACHTHAKRTRLAA